MSTYVEGETTARGWRARKFYLSTEAIALLVAHCTGPRTMSSFLDDLIKRELDSPAERFLREQKSIVIVDEATELTPERMERAAEIGRLHRLGGKPPRTTRQKVDVRDVVRELEKKQPTKKDFKLDDI